MVMPFGLMNAPAMFQRMTFDLFRDLHFVKPYIDDMEISSASLRNTWCASQWFVGALDGRV